MDISDAATDETDLLLRVAQREELAFAELYDRRSPVLYALVFRILRNKVEAEDVLQEAFWQIWVHAATYRSDRGSPFCWMVALARHKAIDRLRSNVRYRERIVEAQAGMEEDVVEPVGSVHLDSAESGATVRRAVSDLPLNQRRPIQLAFFDGLTQQEIAEALDLPLGTVKARIRRGMMRLQTPLTQLRAHV